MGRLCCRLIIQSEGAFTDISLNQDLEGSFSGSWTRVYLTIRYRVPDCVHHARMSAPTYLQTPFCVLSVTTERNLTFSISQRRDIAMRNTGCFFLDDRFRENRVCLKRKNVSREQPQLLSF